MDDEIVTLSLSGEDENMLNEFLAYIRKFPGVAKDNARIQMDTRRGGFTTRYSTFVIHK